MENFSRLQLLLEPTEMMAAELRFRLEETSCQKASTWRSYYRSLKKITDVKTKKLSSLKRSTSCLDGKHKLKLTNPTLPQLEPVSKQS